MQCDVQIREMGPPSLAAVRGVPETPNLVPCLLRLRDEVRMFTGTGNDDPTHLRTDVLCLPKQTGSGGVSATARPRRGAYDQLQDMLDVSAS